MKNRVCKILLILSLLSLPFLKIYGQENQKHINLSYIVKKLEAALQNKKKSEKTIFSLIKEIQERKVNFILTKQNEEFLRKKGGNDSLIKTIQNNVSEDVLESKKYHEEMDALYQKFLNNRKGPTLENYKIALEAAKELIEKHQLDPDDVSRYVKIQISKLEEKIEQISLESGIITDEKEYLFQKFENNRKGPSIEKYENAIKTAKKYLEKFGKEQSERTDYLYNQIAKLEAKIKRLQGQ